MYFCSECGNLYDITDKSPESLVINSPSKTDFKYKMYFECNTCGHSTEIKPMTLILSKKSEDISRNYHGNVSEAKNIIKVPTLLHTRNYVCANKSCTTHAHPETRDAVMYRVGNSYKMQYVCTICSTIFE